MVVYTSVDQIHSEPILRSFEQRSGIKVKAVYDVEAAKTTGLVNRLVAERERPQADVFWNGEFAQTLALKREAVLAPYRSPAAQDLPPPFLDPDGYWIGLASRARVILINRPALAGQPPPRSLAELATGSLPGARIGLAYPLFGTSATHAAALYEAWGAERARGYFESLKRKGVRVVDGNAVVRDLVVAGQLTAGLTDTDDACEAIQRGAPVTAVFPDQDGQGTLLIPGTVALVAGAPHVKEGQRLIDFLVGADAERQMIASGWSQIPLRSGSPVATCFGAVRVKGMAVGMDAVMGRMEAARRDLETIFLR
ncbi:extracellular solute-binding protein [Thiocystis violacea]|uniref:extracellular solute-binding protein n=1 Tax=Thiocystis violacea TaxID=13725 RepID=UPI001A93912D